LTKRTAGYASAGAELAGGADHGLHAMLRAFERRFSGVLPPAAAVPKRLHAAMRYGALAPGKRLRPLLVLTACEAAGGAWHKALPAAAAVECVHAFSLIHDDLPAMDDDDYRRGRLTTHKKYGDALGVLAGDALLALAFEELTRLGEQGVPPARVVDAVRVLAAAAGSRELVGGQALDLEAEGKKATASRVRDIHLRKTGALIAACMELGAIAAGAPARKRAALAASGRQLGLAFQIHDDLLNRGATLVRLGKRAGTDERRRKATWVRAVGEARAREDAAALYMDVLDRVYGLGERATPLCQLIVAVAERRR
jgi:geranylgeranyl diphosphate synthase type II